MNSEISASKPPELTFRVRCVFHGKVEYFGFGTLTAADALLFFNQKFQEQIKLGCIKEVTVMTQSEYRYQHCKIYE